MGAVDRQEHKLQYAGRIKSPTLQNPQYGGRNEMPTDTSFTEFLIKHSRLR